MTREDEVFDIEKSNIDELRRRLKDVMTPKLYEDDNVFERFLRARNQNLDAAEAMLLNHLKWRKANKVDTLREEFTPREPLVKYNIMSKLGNDKEGHPVIYVALGKLDGRGMWKAAHPSELLNYLVCHFENYADEMKVKSKQMGKEINQWVMIFDYDGLLLSNATHKPTIQFLCNMLSMYESNYPERLKSAYLINGSFIFQICFAMVKPFITGATVQKVTICGSDFRDDLREIINGDELPAFLGGNRTDPDGNPKCLQSVKFGGLIPEHYFRLERRMSVIPDAKILIVNRMSRATVEVEVLRPGSNLEWRFTVKNRNINFGVGYKRHQEDCEEEVVPKMRVETVESSEKGMCPCNRAGVYVLEFDNTFSWLHSKHILYSINIANP